MGLNALEVCELFNLDQIERAKAAALPMTGSGRGSTY